MIGPDLLRPRPFSALPGWGEADLSDAWPLLHASARALVQDTLPLRPAMTDTTLRAIAGLIAALPPRLDPNEARAVVERHFTPFLVEAPGFLTGYYEPIVAASPVRSPDFTAPVLGRPKDLVTFDAGRAVAGLPPAHAAARRRADGGLEPYGDRAALEAAAFGSDAAPLVWLRDWTELFLIQVQGSARLRMPDGSRCKLVYAGRNGHPYTSIGRLLIDAGEIRPDAMSLDALKAWLRRHGQEIGDRGRRVMQQNRSYVFFAIAPDDDFGPIGGAGLPLAARRSIAVDRGLWPYGLPFWIESAVLPGFGVEPLRRLFVAQDTGSAIVGPARVDLFLGSGDAAGRDAGVIRHPAEVTVLLPRAA